MKVHLSFMLVFIVGALYAQPDQKAPDDNELSLKARYKEMKSSSQTFKDYKVIKEVVLDKFWQIATDSVAKKRQELAEAKNEITFLQGELNTARITMQEQHDSIKEVIFDSTHITVMGVPFSKNIFLLLSAAVIGSLIFIVSLAFARVKIANGLAKEKTLIADSISHEFEDFKKKSMEKQTKLSRELQSERNRLQEYRNL